MSFKYIAVSALASMTLAACSGASNGSPAQNNISKADTKAQMLGSWYKDCTTKNVAWEIVGVGSQRVKFSSADNATETIQLYSDSACNNLVGQVDYAIDTETGPKTAAEGSSWINMNFKKAELKITDATVLAKVNSSPIAACGIKSWELNKAQDISGALGSTEGQVTCPFQALGTVYDIVLSDGQTMHFGVKDAGHNAQTEAARPQALNRDADATFHKEN